MGNSENKLAGLSEDSLEEYCQLTYLRKGEIIKILKKFIDLGPEQMNANFHYRFDVEDVMEAFPVLKYNPFRDRLFIVFSSLQDNKFSFEDMLDLCSVMSEVCPDRVKASWAFKIFDFDNDSQIGREDIAQAIDRLTWDQVIADESKLHVADMLLEQMDLQHSGSMGHMEFMHAVSKMSEFSHSFYFQI